MRLILPSAFCRKGLLLGSLLAACHRPPPPVAPGEPIPAEPDLVVGTSDVECDALIAAITTYGECPNASDELKAWSDRVAETARQAFDAGKQGRPDANAQHVMAIACRKAAVSLHDATLRCAAGKPPKVD